MTAPDLTLAQRDAKDTDLLASLISRHDHNGELKVIWKSKQSGQPLKKYVKAAWGDENECTIIHAYADDHGSRTKGARSTEKASKKPRKAKR
jgi:hypothetical protein